MIGSFSSSLPLSRRAILGGAALGATALVAGCSPVNSAPSGGRTDEAHTDPLTLSFWKPPGQAPEAENAFYSKMSTGFGSAHSGDKVNHLVLPWPDALTKYTAAFSGGTAPDVSYLILLWLNQFSTAGALVALDDIGSVDLSGIAQGAVDSAKGGDGKLYGMPYYSSRWVLGLNEDVWEQAGKPAVPTTYEEIADFAKLLTFDKSGRALGDKGFDAKNIASYGLCWPGVYDSQANYLWNYFWAYGVDYVSADGKSIGFDNDQGRTVLKLMRQIQESGAATPLTLYADQTKWGEMILTGRAGVSWMAPPTADDFTKYPKARLKVLDIPKGPAGQFVVGGVGYLCVSSKTKYPRTALDYIQYLTSDANVSSYLKQTLLFPVKDSIGADVYASVSNAKAKAFLTASLPQGNLLRLTRPLPYNAEQYLAGEINNYVSGQKDLDAMISDAGKQIATMAKNAGM